MKKLHAKKFAKALKFCMGSMPAPDVLPSKKKVKMMESDSVTIFFGEIYESKESVPKGLIPVRISGSGKNAGKFYGRTKKVAQAKQVAGAMKKSQKDQAIGSIRKRFAQDIINQKTPPSYDDVYKKVKRVYGDEGKSYVTDFTNEIMEAIWAKSKAKS